MAAKWLRVQQWCVVCASVLLGAGGRGTLFALVAGHLRQLRKIWVAKPAYQLGYPCCPWLPGVATLLLPLGYGNLHATFGLQTFRLQGTVCKAWCDHDRIGNRWWGSSAT